MAFYTEIFAQAQSIQIALPKTNIINGNPFASTVTHGDYVLGLSLLSQVRVKANANFSHKIGAISTSYTIPLENVTIDLTKIGAIDLTLLSTKSPATLSLSEKVLSQGVLGLSLLGGGITGKYTIKTSDTRWIAGTYSTTIKYGTYGVVSGGAIGTFTPGSPSLEITVPAFLETTPVGTIVKLSVLNLNNYRSIGVPISGKLNFDVLSSVPYEANLKAGGSNFNFTPLSGPSINGGQISDLQAQFNAGVTGAFIRLTTNDQEFSTSSSFTKNNQTSSLDLKVDPSDLKSRFIEAGTYTVPLVFTLKTSSQYTGAPISSSKNINAEITVPLLSEIISQGDVNLKFTNASNYQTGVSQEITSHLKLSNTTKYDVFVRALTPTISSGTNAIPLNVIQIGPANNQTGINTVNLSAVAQPLITNGVPVIDREINIKYSILPSQISKLLAVPGGTYETSVVYSFILN